MGTVIALFLEDIGIVAAGPPQSLPSDHDGILVVVVLLPQRASLFLGVKCFNDSAGNSSKNLEGKLYLT